MLNDRTWLLLLADHKEYCHHESHLMPKEGRPFDDCHEYIHAWVVFVFADLFNAVRVNSAEIHLLFIVLYDLMIKFSKGVVFLAEVLEVVETYELLASFFYQINVHILSEEEILVFSEHARKPCIKLRWNISIR